MINVDKLKKLMVQNNVTNRELAVHVGLTESMMSYVTRGLREPSLAALIRIAKFLDTSVDELIVKE